MIESSIALVALTLMEIVLGIDNIVFISILTSKLPLAQQSPGRRWGLLLALGTRILLLSLIFWIAHLDAPIITLTDYLPLESVKESFYKPDSTHRTSNAESADESERTAALASDSPGRELAREPGQEPAREFDHEAWAEFNGISVRDFILLIGGLFLIFKSVREIHEQFEGQHGHGEIQQPNFYSVLAQIALMDIIFSIDSVITAVGIAEELWIMIVAVIIAILVMMLFANQVGRFVDQNPTIKMLALNFLLLIGVMLVAEGIGTPINKGYIYFAMAFSLLVEFLNIQLRTKVPASSS